MTPRHAIVSDKQLGDITLLEPAARWLSEQSGQPCAMHVKPAFRPLIDLMPHACWGPEVTGKYDQIWTTSWSSRAAIQTLRLRARQKILLANKPKHVRWWYRLIFHDITLCKPDAEYWGRYFWSMVGGESAFTPARLTQPPQEWAHPELPAQPFIIINPTAAWETKFWSSAQWRALLTALREHTEMPFVITGGGTALEIGHCAEIASGQDVLNLVGRTSLRQYLHTLSRAATVLCIDGAASHLAHAFGVPTLTLFGPTSDQKWHYSSPDRVALAARHFSGSFGPTSGIPISAAFDAARHLLAATRE